MKKYVNIYIFVIVFLTIIITVSCISYNIGISPVSNESKEVALEIEEGSSYLSIANILKENNLIKSETFYKIYIKIFNPSNLEKGTYILNENMGVKKIVETLENSTAITPVFVIPEGKKITDIANYISDVTNYSSEELLNYWQSDELINLLINKYWFITDEIKNEDIRYKLEGYFFPATYKIYKDSSIEDITYKMLDKMDEILSKYKIKIEDSDYNIHEILTLASIVEVEGTNSLDRNGIAQVFYNRLEAGLNLGSDATTYYAANLEFSDRDLYINEINDVNAYNTRADAMAGKLPVGAICSPGEDSINAVLNPKKHDYYYFVADKTGKTYFTKTYEEHDAKINELKENGLWYEYN